MPNGKPGDHPLTDILVHGREVYGAEADRLIEGIARLCSRRELDGWWLARIGWDASPELVLREARRRHAELAARADEGGWEREG
jgi:hypothetical protein